jgi:hypothetical protein
MFREEDTAVSGDVEDAPASLDQLGFDAQLARERSLQPGGVRTVVSTAAVGDRDSHTVDFSRACPRMDACLMKPG